MGDKLVTGASGCLLTSKNGKINQRCLIVFAQQRPLLYFLCVITHGSSKIAFQNSYFLSHQLISRQIHVAHWFSRGDRYMKVQSVAYLSAMYCSLLVLVASNIYYCYTFSLSFFLASSKIISTILHKIFEKNSTRKLQLSLFRGFLLVLTQFSFQDED